jgi:hypothetical protein
MHPLNYIFAYHIDSTTLTDRDYELIPDQGVEISEDPGNAVGDLTEAPNKSSENFDTPAPNPTQEGKPQCITQYFNYYIMQSYAYLLYFALSLGVEMEP